MTNDQRHCTLLAALRASVFAQIIHADVAEFVRIRGAGCILIENSHEFCYAVLPGQCWR